MEAGHQGSLRSWKLYAGVFTFFLLVHAVTFSQLFLSLPKLVRGDAVIAREELIPIFDIKTQFFDQLRGGISPLTSTDELRVAYSFSTSWLKWVPVLPFALVILNAISAWILFYSFFSFAKSFFGGRSVFLVFVSIAASLSIHFILLYAKITHFYTLIFGFSLFSLGLSLTLRELFLSRRPRILTTIVIALVVLINPAIHYHVLFYLIVPFFFLAETIARFVIDRPAAWSRLKKNILFLSGVFALSLIPYVLFIFYILSHMSSSVGNAIPINYDVIYYASSSFSYIFSLTVPGHVDLFIHGFYLPQAPRILGGIITLTALSPLFIFKWSVVPRRQAIAFLLLAAGAILSAWLSIGYAENYSFYSIIRGMTESVSTANPVLRLFSSLAFSVVQILRYPHRFTFILLFLIGLLFTLATAWWYELALRSPRQRLAAYGAVTLLFAVPFLGNADYRNVLLSGSFNGFLEPYTISADLKNIRAIVNETPSDAIFLLPSFESGREAVQNGSTFHFIDKLPIYSLNHPALYYGAGASTENKVAAFMVYRSISYGDAWWESFLIDNLGISYILEPHLSLRDKGFSYLENFDDKLHSAFEKSLRFERVYDGQEYSLYRATAASQAQPPLYADFNWPSTLTFLSEQAAIRSRYYLPVQTSQFLEEARRSSGPSFLKTDSVKRSFYDLYLALAGKAYYPDSKQAPFSKDIVTSSTYTANTFSQINLYSESNPYNQFNVAIPGLMNSKTGQFTRFKHTSAAITFTVPADGMYRILIRAASPVDFIDGSLDGAARSFLAEEKSAAPSAIADFDYFAIEERLAAGRHRLSLADSDEAPAIIESVNAVPLSDLPADFSSGAVTSDILDITRIDGTLYRISVKQQ